MPQLFDDPAHRVDIYLPLAPTTDTGGGVKLNWPVTPSQANVPCQINTSGAREVMRQGQNSITVGNRISFLSSVLTIHLEPGTKLIARDTLATFIVKGITSPGRSPGTSVTDIPPLTYIDAEEIL